MQKAIQRLFIVLIPLLLPILCFAHLRPFTNKDCAALAMPRTVLLVHASWCPHCKAFLPVYKQVSDKEQYKNWIFYQMVNDKFENVCGTAIKGVPLTFKNNLKQVLKGNKPKLVLERFLDSN